MRLTIYNFQVVLRYSGMDLNVDLLNLVRFKSTKNEWTSKTSQLCYSVLWKDASCDPFICKHAGWNVFASGEPLAPSTFHELAGSSAAWPWQQAVLTQIKCSWVRSLCWNCTWFIPCASVGSRGRWCWDAVCIILYWRWWVALGDTTIPLNDGKINSTCDWSKTGSWKKILCFDCDSNCHCTLVSRKMAGCLFFSDRVRWVRVECFNTDRRTLSWGYPQTKEVAELSVASGHYSCMGDVWNNRQDWCNMMQHVLLTPEDQSTVYLLLHTSMVLNSSFNHWKPMLSIFILITG